MLTQREEAGLRMALAEREKRLAQTLLSTQPVPAGQVQEMRQDIERLRRELGQ
ncbi:MAG: hypothetical protein Q8R98_12110 [Rubrivivax sp.]|nr:hypothetical protein [Rubrivivax sp.]MDP3612590.1 hypothetical protein [Rubrivivax sp.]